MAVRARLAPPREIRQEWPWHKVKSSSLSASILFSGDRRMEAENYLASGYGVRLLIEAKEQGWSRLSEHADIWQPLRLKGTVVSPEYGKPYLSATQVFDVRPVARRYLAVQQIANVEALSPTSGQILVTRSGTVGRSTLAHAVHDSHLISDDLLRVKEKESTWWGWIYAYLRAPTVREMMKSAQYGHIIKHLEVSHLEALPILHLKPEHRKLFDDRAREVIRLRDQANQLIKGAEATYEKAIGAPPDHGDGSAGFVSSARTMFGQGRRLEGHYHNPVARAAEKAIISGASTIEPLEKLVESIFVPGRFKHVYGPEGVPYLDSAQILEVTPDVEKRVLSLSGEKKAGYLIEAGTLLMPCSGQLHGIIGSVVLATDWHEGKVFTNHILRIVPKKRPDVRIGYLQAVLSHPTLGRPRVLRGAFGSSVPELAPEDIARISVPRIGAAMEDNIADAMEEAAQLRAQADEVEEDIASEADNYVDRFLAGDSGCFDRLAPQ